MKAAGRDQRVCRRTLTRRGTAQRGAPRRPATPRPRRRGRRRTGPEQAGRGTIAATRRRRARAHRMPLAGNGVAERVHPSLRIRRERRQRGEDDAEVPSTIESGPRQVDPDADSSRRAVARPGRHRDPCRDAVARDRDARDLGRLEQRRHPGGRKLEGFEDIGRPPAVGDVSSSVPEASATSVAHCTREPEPDVVLGRHDPGDPPMSNPASGGAATEASGP